MLGPTRFVNSDCHPNCDYDFTSDADIVRIRALRSIRSGDEITVKYGEAFFDSKECLCKTCLEKDPIIGEGDPILRNSSQNHGAFLPDTLTEPKQLPVVSSSRAAKLSPPAKKSFSLLQKLKYYEETETETFSKTILVFPTTLSMGVTQASTLMNHLWAVAMSRWKKTLTRLRTESCSSLAPFQYLPV